MDLLDQMNRGPKYNFKSFEEIVVDIYQQLMMDDKEALVYMRLTLQLDIIIDDWHDKIIEIYNMDNFNNPYFVGEPISSTVISIIDKVVDLCQEEINGL